VAGAADRPECPSPRGGGGPARPEAAFLNRYPDVLQAAWSLSDAEFERIVRLPAGAMRQWRNHELCLAAASASRLARLFLFHETLRFGALGHPPDFAAYLRRVWHSDSVIGARSIVDLLGDTDDRALECLEHYLRAVW
jgi:hypothetical protein